MTEQDASDPDVSDEATPNGDAAEEEPAADPDDAGPAVENDESETTVDSRVDGAVSDETDHGAESETGDSVTEREHREGTAEADESVESAQSGGNEQAADSSASEHDGESAPSRPAEGGDADDADAGGEAEGAAGEGRTEGAAAGGEADDQSVESEEAFPFEDVDEQVDIEEAFGDDAPDGLDSDVSESLVERVDDSSAETVAQELAGLRARVTELESELDERDEQLQEVTAKLKRKQADFENYKKRMQKRREQEKQRATEDLVERLLDVRDNLARALDHDDGDAVLDGIESTLREFDRVLDDENVDVIEPEPGDDVDPQRHEVLMRVESDQPADAIADVHRPGYVMADKVLRPAQITVSQSDDG